MATEDPALPPNPELLNRQPKWFKPVFKGVIVASILFTIVVFTTPLFIRSHHHRPGTREVNNARQLSLALLEFDADYGSYPNDVTSAEVTESIPEHGYDLTGTSSNALFRQIFAAGITQSEDMFYSDIKDSKRPDGDITIGHTIEPGECGFSYISGLTSKDDPATPIVLLIDCSVRTYDIQNDGHIYDKGIDLLSSKHPVWKGKKPDIRYLE